MRYDVSQLSRAHTCHVHHPTSIAELGVHMLQGATGISGGEWSTDWQVRTSSKILYLLKRLTKIGAVPKKAPPPSPQQDGIWSIPVEPPLQPFPAAFPASVIPIAADR